MFVCTCAFQMGYLFDHPGTVFFSVFMSFWAVTFLEYWKRKMATLAHHWDCMDFHEEEVSEFIHFFRHQRTAGSRIWGVWF